jgi:hypothetical protein
VHRGAASGFPRSAAGTLPAIERALQRAAKRITLVLGLILVSEFQDTVRRSNSEARQRSSIAKTFCATRHLPSTFRKQR